MSREACRPVVERSGRQRGAVLIIVLAVLAVASLTLAVLFGYVSGGMKAGGAYQSRIDKVQATADAIDFAVNAIRNDNALGRSGSSSTWSYGGVSVTCTGDAGSGVSSGAGRTDRTVTCANAVIRSQVRFFDRGGAANGVVVEQLAWTVLI